MIQRKQTVFLLLAVMATLACAFLQTGLLEASTMGADVKLYNYCTLSADHSRSFVSLPLFVLLLISAVLGIMAVFDYKHRPRQARLCSAIIGIYLAWYVGYVAIGCLLYSDYRLIPSWPAGLPLFAMIMTWLARKGIISDERLVRAADRIR